MFPGHFKIVGHSGTEFKNRKAFKMIKNVNKTFVFKYGNQYGKKKFEVDAKRMAVVEEQKNKKLIIFGVLFSLIMFFVCAWVGCFIKQSSVDLTPIIIEAKYEWEKHGSEMVLKRIEEQKVLEKRILPKVVRID